MIDEKTKLLFDFLNLKHALLVSVHPALENQLFTKEDAQDMISWKPKHVSKVYLDLASNIIEEEISDSITNCPFCLYAYHAYNSDSNFCSKCAYGRRHGFCNDSDSHYIKVIRPAIKNSKLYGILIKSAEYSIFIDRCRKIMSDYDKNKEQAQEEAYGFEKII